MKHEELDLDEMLKGVVKVSSKEKRNDLSKSVNLFMVKQRSNF